MTLVKLLAKELDHQMKRGPQGFEGWLSQQAT